MEEINQIFFRSLASVGIPVPSHVQTVADIDASSFVSLISSVGKKVQPPLATPEVLPNQMSKRFKICSFVAETISDLGYPSKIDFNNLMYPQPEVVQSVLNFLIGLIPKKQQVAEEIQPLKAIISDFKKIPYALPCFLPKKRSHDALIRYKFPNYKHKICVERVSTKHRPAVDTMKRVLRKGFNAKNQRNVLELINFKSSFNRFSQLQDFDIQVTNEIQSQSQEEHMRELEEEIQMKKMNLKKNKDQIDDLQLELAELREDIIAVEQERLEKAGDLEMYRDVVEMMEDPEVAKRKMDKLYKKANDSIDKVDSYWQETFAPKKEECDTLEQQNKVNMDIISEKEAYLKELREKQNDLIRKTKEKETLKSLLKREWDATDKGENRSFYCERIYELHKSIEKQRGEIKKISLDITIADKAIKKCLDNLKIAEGALEQAIFRHAKRGKSEDQQLYKTFVDVHYTCRKLLETVEQQSRLETTIKKHQVIIERQERIVNALPIEKLSKDYSSIKKENSKLKKQIHKLRSQQE
ncbi:hypothetical protein PCE1_004985 [Barthelona sp. PCE]